MRALVDLPTRRVEAWKYTDLASAMDESVQVVLRRDRGEPEVAAAQARGGVIAALAAQCGEVSTVEAPEGAEVVRIDRPRYGNLEPRFVDIAVKPGARLLRIVIQESAAGGVVLDAARVSVAAGAQFRQIILAEGARLARLETIVNVEGDGAVVELSGLYMAGDGRHADLTSTVTHKAPGGITRQLVKGVAAKGGRGVFQGKIVVERAAQKTDARQHHRGMLLDEGAEICAKPELLIHADDVACAHGNTAGGLDAEALFYLRSRGVPGAEASALLTEAFLLEVLPDWLSAELRVELEGRVGAWLRGRR